MAYKPVSQNVTDNKNAEIPSSDAVFDKIQAEISTLFPTQSGNNGKFLTTDGSETSWSDLPPTLANTELSNLAATTALNSVLRGQNGTQTSPAFSFTSSPNSGIWYDPTYENPGEGGFGAIRISRNGISQLLVGTNIVTTPGAIHSNSVNAYALNATETLFSNIFTNGIRQTEDSILTGDGGTYSYSWGRDATVNQGWGFRRPFAIDASRRLRVGKKISYTAHYGATLSVTLPETMTTLTQNTSNGTTLYFDSYYRQGILWHGGVGDTLEFPGLGEARIQNINLNSKDDPIVVTLDTDLGGTAVANKSVILKYDLASFRLANGTETLRIDYNGKVISKNYRLDPHVETASTGIDWKVATTYELTLTTSVSLTFSNPVNGGSYILKITQNAVGGHTVAWPANVKWAGGTPSLTGTANSIDIATMIYMNGTYYASFAGGFV